MASSPTIRVDTDGPLAVVSLARPDKRNALTRDMLQELGTALQSLNDDAGVHAVVLRSDGPVFCAGVDLSILAELAGAPEDEFRTFIELAQRPYRLLATMPKPTVAAVQGHALGAGFQLALACDLRVAADASFAILEARYGLIPDLGGIHHLARIAGPSAAKDLIWTARSIDGAEAHRLGLVDRLTDPADLDDTARELARLILAQSPTAVALAKDLVTRTFETPLAQAFDHEADAQAEALRSLDG
jgi:enoyl-CoA hydratase/carnithine racemase